MEYLKDFDFLIGKFEVRNEKLRRPLNVSKEWEVFYGEITSYRILNGKGVIEEYNTSYFGKDYSRLTIRLIDSEVEIWTIFNIEYKKSVISLSEKLVGKFHNGKGIFYGTEIYENRKLPLRYTWEIENENSFVWKRSYFDEINNVWETNWIMNVTNI